VKGSVLCFNLSARAERSSGESGGTDRSGVELGGFALAGRVILVNFVGESVEVATGKEDAGNLIAEGVARDGEMGRAGLAGGAGDEDRDLSAVLREGLMEGGGFAVIEVVTGEDIINLVGN
jgi:hypothetical protein